MTLSTNKGLIESFVEDIFYKHNILATEKYFFKDFTTGDEDFKQFLKRSIQGFSRYAHKNRAYSSRK